MKTILLAACAALSLSACATITRGTTTAFEVQTTPSGAKVATNLPANDGKSVTGCEPTPCVIPKVSREANFQVTITKPGFKTFVTNVTHATAGGGAAGMAGNVILGGLIGAVVDSNNGSTQDLVPNPLVVALEAESAPAPATPAPPAAAGTAPIS
jgi:hypothetical protein